MITQRTRVPPRYRLVEEVGQGGMAIVYRAQDETLKREVAVKVLHQHLWSEPESKARLEREARAVAKLRHDNILEIFDYSGTEADSAFIVTEFIDGQTLKQFMGAHPIKHPEVAELIAAELAGALAHAHGLGIIHRDVKPENVMIRKDGLLKLMDFGIAQVLDLERMTVTGQLLGSPAYMAPELIEGKPLDVRTDVFSVGILLYQIATGTLPFSGKNPHEVLRRITEGRFADPRTHNRLCGAGLCRILARALARNPVDRYPQMGALVADLRDDLTEAGLGEPREELRAFFADPPGYQVALPERMTPALAKAAKGHLALRSPGRAIDAWNRVLAYAPTDADVLGALGRLEGRTRLRQIARTAALAAGVIVLFVGMGALLFHKDRPAPRPRPPMVGPTTVATPAGPSAQPRPVLPPPAGGGSQARAKERGETDPELPGRTPMGRVIRARALGGAERSESGPLPDTTSGAAEAPGQAGAEQGRAATVVPANQNEPSPLAPPVRVFILGPTPQNVDIYLDGELQFSYDTDHRTLPVTWTTNHIVEFRSPSGCCFVERIEVGPDRPVPTDNVIARQLKWKPARLVVTTSPSEVKARVMVRDPGRSGRGTVVEPGEEANIPFFPTDEGQKEVEVSVDAAVGFAAERITVRAGERKSVVLTLGAAP